MESPAGRSVITIEKPIDVVRAAFFDVDHHVRDKVHSGVSQKWASPTQGGDRRVMQETKVIGKALVEAFVVEEGPGATWVRRYVEGPNEGARFVATFEGDDAQTKIQIVAYPPTKGAFDNGLGKLSQLGLEKALQRLLTDHKRALEGYEIGKARGAIGEVIKKLRDLTSAVLKLPAPEQKSGISNFLEAACIVAIADEEVDVAERQVLQSVAKQLCFLDMDDAAIVRLTEQVKKAVATDGLEARCEKIGVKLRGLGFAQLGVMIAALVAQVSHGLDVKELAVIQRIAKGAGMSDGDVAMIIGRIDRALSGEGSATS